MTGVGNGAGGLTQTMAGAPGADGLLELLARADELRTDVEVKVWNEALHPRGDGGQFAKAEKGDGYKGKEGASADVKAAQRALIAMGFLSTDSGKNGGVDGLYGPKTEAAVRAFQKANGLPITGKVDGRTVGALKAAAKGGGRTGGKTPPAKAPAKAAAPKAGDKPPAKAAAKTPPAKAETGEDKERAVRARELDVSKANLATDKNVNPSYGKTYGALREAAQKPGGRMEEDYAPATSPTGAKIKDFDGSSGTMTYTDGTSYDETGWHRPADSDFDINRDGRVDDQEAEGPSRAELAAAPRAAAPAAAAKAPAAKTPPPTVADQAAGSRVAAIPKTSPTGAPVKTRFEDGSAIYADGTVWDPEDMQFRKRRPAVGTKDVLADLLARATTDEETAVQPDVETKGIGADGAWDFDASPMLADAEDGYAEVGGLAYKEVGAQVIDVDKRRGIVTTLVSVTGIADRVKDVIEAGAYAKTLTERKPRGVWSHKWEEPISKTLEIRELPPGDADLPKTMKGPGGADVPWPREAGALKVKTQFNLLGARGQQAFADVVFFDDEQQWSIGYQVPKGGARIDSKTGLRHIHDLELYEYSPVLFGAMPHAVTLSVKSAQHAFRALDTIGLAELEHEDELRGVAGMETKAVRRAYVRDEDGKFAEVPGGSGSGLGPVGSGPSGDPARDRARGPMGTDLSPAGGGEAQGKPKFSVGDRASYTPYGKTTPETVEVTEDDGDTIGIRRPNGTRTFVTADQLTPVAGSTGSSGGAFAAGASKDDATPDLPRNDEVAELQEKVAQLEALVRGLAAQDDEDEVDPELLVEQKADGFAPCSQCGSTNADAYADGTGRCEDCGYPLARTEAKNLPGATTPPQPDDVVVEVPVHQHLEVAADVPATPGAPEEVGEPHAIPDDPSLDLVADELARDDAPPALPVEDGTVVDGVEVKYDTSPVGDAGGRENWVDKAGGLPPFIRAVAHALIREGKTKSAAIAIAVARIKAWAGGGGEVSAATRAKAVTTVAQWEAMKSGKAAAPAELEQKALVPMGEFELLAARRLALEVD